MVIRVRSSIALGLITTTKLLSITTAETVYTLGSGNIALEATNISAINIYYGDSGVLANSGGVIVENGSKFWDSVIGNFQVYFAMASAGVTGRLVIHEYAGD